MNEEYEYCCSHDGRGVMAAIYRDFGNVYEREFTHWWVKHGRKIFREKKHFKKTRLIESSRELYQMDWEPENTIVIEIPLSLKPQTVKRQVALIIKKAYEGRVIDVFKSSTARRMIIKSKMRMSTVENLLNVLETRRENPTLRLWEIGQLAGIELDLMARNKEEIPSLAMENRRMTIAVSRLLKQANYLVINAGNGKFPSIQKPVEKTSVV
jgi:hypothetical protein